MPRSMPFLASLAAAAALASSALGVVKTYTIDFFPDDPVVNHIRSLSFDPRLAEPFLRGATVVDARLIIDFTPSDGFSAGDLSVSLFAPIQPPAEPLWIVNGGTDLGWTGPGPYSATHSTTTLNGEIPVGGRGVWFFDLYSGADIDPPVISGTFGPNTRIELDYVPLPQVLVSTGEGYICADSPATFTARTTCEDAPVYQWQAIGGPLNEWTTLVNGANMSGSTLIANASGANTNTLTVDRGPQGWPTTSGSEIYFRCLVTTTECGAIESTETLPPLAPREPGFVELDFPFQTCINGEATFRVFTDGVPPFTFAWRKNGTPINPATNPSATDVALVFPRLTAADNGSYDCLVTDACGTVTSTSLDLSVCAADFDCSGGASIDDIFIFINAWFAQDPRTDMDGAGINIDDIFVFINAWFAGC